MRLFSINFPQSQITPTVNDMTWRTEKLAQDIRGLTIASLVFSCLNLPLVVFTCFVNIYWLAGRVPERDPWRSRSSGHDLTLRRLLVASVAICTSYSIICAFVTIGNIAWCSLVLDKRRRFATRQLWLKRYLVFATPMIVAMAVFCIVSGAVVVTYYVSRCSPSVVSRWVLCVG